MHTFKCPHCTAPLNIDDTDARLAIKCEHCGMSAPVPRAFREKQGVGGRVSDPSGGLSDAVVGQVAALLARGQAIEAIKLVRQSTGLGLKESKDMVDALKDGDADRLNVLLQDLQSGRVYVSRSTSGSTSSTVVINTSGAARAAGGAAGAGCGAVVIVMISLVVAGALFVTAAVRNNWFANVENAIPVALGTAVNRVSKAVVPPFAGLNLRDEAKLVSIDDKPQPDILALAYEPMSSKTYVAYLDIVSNTVRWRAEAETDTKFEAAGDTVYAASKSRLSALDRTTGAVRWEASLTDKVAASCDDCLQPASERVYVLSNDSELQAFDTASGRKMWSKRLAVVTPRIEAWDGAVVAIDRNDEANSLPAQVRVFDADGEQRVQFNLTCDIPRTESGGGGNMTAQPYDTIWVDQDEGALYAWFGGFSSCVQKRNLSTGGLVWSAGFDTAAQGRNGRFIKAGNRIVVVGDKSVIGIDAETGAGKVLLDAGDDFRELYPIGAQGDVAIVRALKARGTARFEIWGIDLVTGERRWALPFDEEGGPFDFPDGFSGLLTKNDKRQAWVAHLTPAGLRIVRLATDPFRFRVETVNPADGVSGGMTDVPITGDYTIISPDLLGWRGDVAWIHLSGDYNALDVAAKKIVYETSP